MALEWGVGECRGTEGTGQGNGAAAAPGFCLG